MRRTPLVLPLWSISRSWGIPIDLIVVTPEEVEKYRNAAGTVIREAVREGKVLYERAA